MLGIIFILILILPSVFAEEFLVGEVETFTSPDSGLSVLEDFIRSANTSLYINVYTFTSDEIAYLVLKEIKEGVEVYIIVDGSPAGGMKDKEREILDVLSQRGVKVYLFSTKKLRFNHAKYAIADNTSLLVVTENFGRSGFPSSGEGNRGWGAVIYDRELAEYLAELFFSDLKFSEPFEARGMSSYFKVGEVKEGRFKPRFYRGTFIVKTAVAPENALEEALKLIDSANTSLYVEEFYAYTYFGRGKEGSVEETPNFFLEACLEAARRGVEVKIILDSTWYNIDRKNPRSNFYTVEYLNEVARRENLNLEARLGCFSQGIKKYHVKGFVVDNKAVMLGSMNWNLNSPTKNREVNVIIYGDPAKYFSEVFLYDWNLCSEREEDYNYIIAGLILILVFIFMKKLKKWS